MQGRIMEKWRSLLELLRSENQRRQPVVLFGRHGRRLISKTEIERQVAQDSPVILHIGSDYRLAHPQFLVCAGNCGNERRRCVHQERCERSEVCISIVGPCTKCIGPDYLDGNSSLYGMRSSRHREVVVDLYRGVVKLVVSRSAKASRILRYAWDGDLSHIPSRKKTK